MMCCRRGVSRTSCPRGALHSIRKKAITIYPTGFTDPPPAADSRDIWQGLCACRQVAISPTRPGPEPTEYLCGGRHSSVVGRTSSLPRERIVLAIQHYVGFNQGYSKVPVSHDCHRTNHITNGCPDRQIPHTLARSATGSRVELERSTMPFRP